jgi:hypothetical protein
MPGHEKDRKYASKAIVWAIRPNFEVSLFYYQMFGWRYRSGRNGECPTCSSPARGWPRRNRHILEDPESPACLLWGRCIRSAGQHRIREWQNTTHTVTALAEGFGLTGPSPLLPMRSPVPTGTGLPSSASSERRRATRTHRGPGGSVRAQFMRSAPRPVSQR